MKNVKEICLGVAVAGMVAGAGSTVACAVAYADGGTPDGTASSDTATPARSHARPARGQATRIAAPDADATDRAANKPSTPAPSAATRNNRRVSPPAVTLTAPDLPDVDVPARTVAVDAPTPTAPSDSPTPPVPPAAAAATPRPVASVRITRIAVDPAALLPAPSTPLTPVAPLPFPFAPVIPVAPASTVSSASSTSTSRSRQASASVTAVQIGSPTPTHVLLIGTDGTNLSKILADPNFLTGGFADVMDEGITGATSIVGHTTISGPSWSTILTGAWDNKTGVINNLFNPAPYTPWPTAINMIEKYRSSVVTSVVADWQYINDMAGAGGYPVDNNIPVAFDTSWANTDAKVVTETNQLINAATAGGSSFIFSYQVQVDEAGHSYGGGSPQYAQAVQNVSANIKDIMNTVHTWETNNPGEKWTVIITTDHGHQQSQGFGHGFQSPNETSSFVIYRDGSLADGEGKQNQGYANPDITPTIVNAFGIGLRSDYDGVPLSTKSATSVTPAGNTALERLTNLNKSLQTAVNAIGYPNIGTDLTLGLRTVVTSIPYFLNGFVETVTGQLQGIVNQDIFLISALAGVTKTLVQITGDVLVAATQAVARVVAYLTGAGTIAPTDPPLTGPPLPGASELVDGQLVLT